ncbi:MAG: hypothetical protein JSS02_17370, partial [Planctomycetes bacterium]|nr:hypothetical protein [Planctomycetota bacterium]
DLVMGGGDGTKRPAGQPAEDEARRFRVVADTEQNRLLMWVNDTEYEEVQGLLTELGENATPGQEAEPATRVVDLPAQADPDELLRKLQERLAGQLPNRVEPGPRLKGQPARQTDRPARPGAQTPVPGTRPAAANDLPNGADWWNLLKRYLPSTAGNQSVAEKVPVSEPAVLDEIPALRRAALEIIPVSQQVPIPEKEKADGAAPVIIDRGADGRWTISSQDEQAVELVKKLLGELAPLTGDFHIFRLKNKTASATAISENLRQIFDQKQKVDKTVPRFFDPNSGKWISNTRETDTQKPTKPPAPKFIVDVDSNSILAVGADQAQLKVIEQVVTLYDVPDSKDPAPKRTTKLLKIQHAQVRQLSDSVKEVYRDLLTVNEPPARPDQPRPPQEKFVYSFGTRDGTKGPLEVQVRYKGQLSISIDEPSNTMLVSAPDALLEDVVKTIESLDDAAAVLDQRVRVVRINRQINSLEFQKRLQRIGTRPQFGKSQSDSSSSSGR